MDGKASGIRHAGGNPLFMVVPHAVSAYAIHLYGIHMPEMKDRYTDRRIYFDELAQTSREYIYTYMEDFMCMKEEMHVLEIGCGEGGILLPFAERGFHVCGVDVSSAKVANAQKFFRECGQSGMFICCDFLHMDISGHIGIYDLVILHDVLEHIDPSRKEAFIRKARQALKQNGLMMVGFPAWQMPFGGHQQICHKRICRIPWIHVLPSVMYRKYLEICGEHPATISELMSIRQAGMRIEDFESLCSGAGYRVKDRTLWLINPHYKAKFGLWPRKLPALFCRSKWLRNHMSTSCFYILAAYEEQ